MMGRKDLGLVGRGGTGKRHRKGIPFGNAASRKEKNKLEEYMVCGMGGVQEGAC